MGDAILNKYIYNQELMDVATFDEKYKAVNPSAYEVIRIMRGEPLFLGEHYERLVNTAKTVGAELPATLEQLRGLLCDLAKSNNVENHNAKIVLNDISEGVFKNFYIFMLHTSYPTDEMYENGVKTAFFEAVRSNPNAKIIDQELRDRENRFIEEKGIFEAILVNDSNQITEGSRSNIFFIKGREIYTAPAKDVLLGVTRQRVIRVCKEHGINIHEEIIERKTSVDFEAAFISGTSPKVLPISCIGGQKLDVNNETLRAAMKFYDEEIEKSLCKI